MDKFDNIVVIIPALNPDIKFVNTVKELRMAGFNNLIVVNDGSASEYLKFFDMAISEWGEKITLLKHSVNLGQGRAYKTAFNYYLENYMDSIGVIQCDADGQHAIEDIVKCAELLREYPDEFILGVRDFSDKGIPFRSRFGNYCTNAIFNIFCGIKVRDTQTGLKGIPYDFVKFLIETPGERFEYATSVLLEVSKRNIKIHQFDIRTIYINGNESSHFNPIIDSIRIYSLLLKYMISSLSAFIVDILVFCICISLLRKGFPQAYIVVSTYLAKIVSCSYSFVVNKELVFHNKDKIAKSLTKFILLCVVQSTISAASVSYLFELLQWNEALIKIIVDTVLFFVSFQVQQKWVFRGESYAN